MVLVLLGALLFIGGVLFIVLQPLKGRLSRARSVNPTPRGKTLEPERPGRGFNFKANLPGLLMMMLGAVLLLVGAGGF